MKLETYLKNKKLFEDNYNKIEDRYLPLNIPIDLCTEGIYNKQKFFTYFSYDVGARGSSVVSSISTDTIYKTWDGKYIRKIDRSRERGMFRHEGEFERFDKYIKSRKKEYKQL